MMSSMAPNSLEIDYIAICSSKNNNFRCPKTDLTLSLPGSQDHPHQQTKPNASSSAYPLNSTRDFSAAAAVADASSSGKWGLSVYGASPCQLALFSHGAGAGAGTGKVVNVKDMDIDVASDSLKTPLKKNPTANAPAPKTQAVGWPPIRSFRKNSLASSRTKNSNEADEKSGLTCLYVKVSMDGAPYLRKVDLKLYKNYKELSLALKKMFSSFPVGGKDWLRDSHLNDQSQGSEHVLTYEDKDSDWMLVGDVPWDMFTSTCKRLRIMKGTEGIRLGKCSRVSIEKLSTNELK